MSYTVNDFISRLQSNIIKTKEYTNIIASSNTLTNGAIYFMKFVPISLTSPWIVKYKITTNMPQIGNSTQMSSVSIGGINNKISFYNINNIIYDTANISAQKHVIVFTKTNNNQILFGIHLGSKYNQNHNIKLQIEYYYGGTIMPYSIAKSIVDCIGSNALSTCSFNQLDFSTQGNKNFPDTDIEIPQSFATVAITGKYSDLIDKPQLLDTSMDNNEQILYLTYHT